MTESPPIPSAGHYELPLSEAPVSAAKAFAGKGPSVPEPLLIRNILWFCSLRWLIIAIIVAFGILGRYEGVLRQLGLLAPGWEMVSPSHQ